MAHATHMPLKPKAGTRQLSRHPWLERLLRTHIAVPLTLFFGGGLAVLLFAILNAEVPTGQALGVLTLGLITFTFVEYGMHRWVFHIHGHQHFQYTVHGVHHEYPQDKERLAMPPIASLTIATGLLLLCRFALGDVGLAFFSGFIWGYAVYLSVHYCVHAMRPPQNALRRLWKHHHLHHHKNTAGYFGVSSPMWDWVFGTLK